MIDSVRSTSSVFAIAGMCTGSLASNLAMDRTGFAAAHRPAFRPPEQRPRNPARSGATNETETEPRLDLRRHLAGDSGCPRAASVSRIVGLDARPDVDGAHVRTPREIGARDGWAVGAWEVASLAQQIALPYLCVGNYSQVFVCDLFACEATSHAPGGRRCAMTTRTAGRRARIFIAPFATGPNSLRRPVGDEPTRARRVATEVEGRCGKPTRPPFPPRSGAMLVAVR